MYEIKCDDCKRTIGYTDSARTSAAGGHCGACFSIGGRVMVTQMEGTPPKCWACGLPAFDVFTALLTDWCHCASPAFPATR